MSVAALLPVLAVFRTAVPPPPPPRYVAGLVGSFAQVEGGGGVRQEAGALGVFATYRPYRYGAATVRYQREHIGHEYNAFDFDMAYHRLTLAGEGRLTAGRIDGIGWAGPELTLAHSSLEAGAGSRGHFSLDAGVAMGGGVAFHVSRVELRADISTSFRNRHQDVHFSAAIGWTWP